MLTFLDFFSTFFDVFFDFFDLLTVFDFFYCLFYQGFWPYHMKEFV